MKFDEVNDKVKTLIATHVNIPKTDYDEKLDLFDDLGIDSIDWMALVVEIENEFDISFENEFLLPENLRNHEGITNAVKELLLIKGS